MQYAIGDKVFLNSGSPELTVERRESKDKIIVSWASDDDKYLFSKPLSDDCFQRYCNPNNSAR